MPSKFDQLRQGQAVEIEPGVSGRLNKDKKTLELSTGQVLNVGHNKSFFPDNEQQVALSRQKENVEKKAKGPVGEFLHQYSSKGIPGGISDWRSYLTQTGEEYATRKQAENQVSERISQESPYISGAATGANIATDLALTRGMSALKAAPLLTAGSAGSRLATEPQEVLGETAMAAAGGKGLDLVGGYFSRVASRRGASRAIPGQQAAVAESNAQQAQAFNSLKQNVKNVNEARLQQHQTDLNARQNNMIKSQNAYEQAKAARDTEVVRLKNQAEIAKAQRSSEAARLEAEYKAAKISAEQETKRLNDEFKLAQSQYQESLKKLPELQKQAQAEYSANVVKNASEIEKSFPKSSRINSEELGVGNFIEDSINQSGLAGTREAAQAKRVLNSLFPEGELIGGRELSKKYKALEDSIQRATPEVQSVLNNFKNHLGERLPVIVENSVAYHKIMPLLQRTIRNDVKSIVSELGLDPKVQASVGRFAETNAFHAVKNNITPANFIEKIQSGELASEIANSIGSAEAFLVDLTPTNIKFMQKQGTLPVLMKEAERQHAYYVQELTQKIQSRLARYELKAMESARNASQKLGKDVKNTYGLSEPVVPPPAPTAPNPVAAPPLPGELPPVPPTQLPPPIAPPQAPPLPGKPSLMPDPMAPTPQAMPTLPPAQGMADRMGDFLEKPILGGGSNNLLKLGGLKYLLGKAAIPAEAAYVGMKGLTAPGAGGEAARLSFKQAGIQAIEMMAQKYPSYNNGILENPMERRSLTKEIEDDPEIPIEQKAVIQSKVNRGKRLQERL